MATPEHDILNKNDPAHNLNQRLPDLQLPGDYPYVRHFQFRDGSWTRQDETPGSESYSRGHITGTFTEHTVTGGYKSHTAGSSHHYTTEGTTETTDLNRHGKVGSSTVHQIGADHYQEHFNDSMHSIGKSNIQLNGGTKYQHSTGKIEQSSTEDWVTDHNDGHHHHNVDGDHVQYTGNNMYDYIGGEKGTYLPKGNFDIKVTKGKYQVLTGDTINVQSKKDIKIESDTKITLKVGSSTIVIEPSKITITSGEIDFSKS
jgi:hypothetical protein